MIFLTEQGHHTDVSTVLGNSLVILISFILLVVILQKVAMKPLMKVVEDRQTKIHDELNRAEQLQQAAQEKEVQAQQMIEEANRKARQILVDAKNNSDKLVETQRLAVKEELTQLRSQAVEQIEKERQDMMQTLQKDVANMSVDLAKKILKREITVQDHQKIIDDFINNLD